MNDKYDKPLEEYSEIENPHTGNKVKVREVVDRVDFVRGCVYSYNACFGALLDNLNFVYTFDIPTQATDGTRLFINPEWTSSLTDGEIRFVMIHELMHSVFNHIQRGMSHRKMLSNIAADFEANGAAYIDKFVTTGQLDKMGACFSEKYTNSGYDLWAYEAIYEDLLNSGFIPYSPELDIVWPKNTSSQKIKTIHSSREWKHGHSDARDESNKTLNDEYSKISKKPTERYSADEIKHALEKAAKRIGSLVGKPKKHKDIPLRDDELDIDENFQTYAQGWDYSINESLSQISNVLKIIDGQFGKGNLSGKSESEVEVPAVDPSEAALNIPRPNNSNSGCTKKLSKEDILSQQEGANIARKAGYKGDYIKEESLTDIENSWNENIQKIAGKDGSELLTRHIFDMKASNYNWQYELRKLMNRSLSNATKHGNEWGEKRGLARNTMTLKHKKNYDGMKDIVFLVDCSGSISDNMLSNILSECWSITQKCNVRDIIYAYFTTQVELVETNNTRLSYKMGDIPVMKLDNKSRQPKGGHITGGTDFKNALDWVNDIGGAKCVIVITDGYDTPVEKPGKVMNMIWCVYDNKSFKSADTSKVVHLDTTKMKSNVH